MRFLWYNSIAYPMSYQRTIIVGLLLIFFVAIGAIGYVWRTPKQNTHPSTLSVFVSFYPLADMVKNIGGQYVSVHDLLPPGGEPHDFEPSPKDFATLGKADLFIYNGAHLEPWIEKWMAGSFSMPAHRMNMVDELVKANIPLINKNGAFDPHIWVDPVIFAREAEIVRDTLVAIDPAHTNEYQMNAESYRAKLKLLDEQFKKELAVCEKKEIIASHDAFGYLAREYGFFAVPIAGISPDEEPSPETLARIANVARQKDIKYIFFESTVSPKLSETIAREVGARTLVLNPVESLTLDDVQSGEDYVSTMLMNLNNLKQARICQ